MFRVPRLPLETVIKYCLDFFKFKIELNKDPKASINVNHKKE